jgi:hypothetical protein
MTGATGVAKGLSNAAVTNASVLAMNKKSPGGLDKSKIESEDGNSKKATIAKPRESIATLKNRLREIRNSSGVSSPARGTESKSRSMANNVRVLDNTTANRFDTIPAAPSYPSSNQFQTSAPFPMDEARDPSPDDRKYKGRGTVPVESKYGSGDNTSERRREQRRASTEVLPGLEADDIVPGLGEVLRAMNLYAEEEVEVDGDNYIADRAAQQQPPLAPPGYLAEKRTAQRVPAAPPGSASNPVRLPEFNDREEIFMYEEFQPSFDDAPKKKSAASFATMSPIVVVDSAVDPVEQRDSGVVERSQEVDVIPDGMVEDDGQTFWHFLTCQSVGN